MKRMTHRMLRSITFLAVLLAPAIASAGTVSGTVTYENKIYQDTGFTGTEYLPVRLADVEIVRSSDGVVLGSGETGIDGTFSIVIPDGGTLNIFLRAYARQDNAAVNVVVKNNSTSGSIYTATTTGTDQNTSAPIAGFNMAISIAGGAASAFNIFDVAVISSQFAATVDIPFPSPLPKLTLYWEAGSSNGTYFSKAANAIFLLGLSTDSDDYDDDIVAHEIGHFLASNFSRDDSPGGNHTISGQYDLRLAWSEGWAHYWSCAARRFAGSTRYPAPQTIIDTFGTAASSFEIETPSLASQTVMATNEVAVAAILWDISDNSPSEAVFDALAKGDDEIWTVFNNELPLRSQISLEDFYLAWRGQVVPADVTATAAILENRGIRYTADAYESNNTPATATLIASSTTLTNTIFPAADQDWFKFTVGLGDTVTAETLNLRDGADTVVEIYDSNGTTVLASNDDRTTADVSSYLRHEFTASGTFYLRVTAYAGPLQVAELGSYDIRLTLAPNASPTVAISASTSSGTVPFAVNFSVTASDSDGTIASYDWDFNGDGVFEYSTTYSGSISYTYTSPGMFTAMVRVTDNKGASTIATTTITVASPVIAPTTTVTIDSVSGSTAPVTAMFTVTLVPTATMYRWDFDGDGVIDSSSSTSNTAVWIYTVPGSYEAIVYIADQGAATYVARASQIVVNAGVNPPALASFTASSNGGNRPLTVILTASATDNGSISTYEWDFDGDGRYDRKTFGLASVSYTYTAAGTFTPRVRVTDNSNLSVILDISSPITVVQVSSGGWIVDPSTSDTLWGETMTITAQTVPAGTSKKIQFQYRINTPQGAWSDVGAPMTSAASLVRTSWDIRSFADATVLDLRAVIDDVTATETVTVSLTSTDPGRYEYADASGNRVIERRIDRHLSTVVNTSDGLTLRFPLGSISASLNPRLRIVAFNASSKPPSGSSAGLSSVGGAFDLSFIDSGVTIVNDYTIEFAYGDDDDNGYIDGGNVTAATLNIHWWNPSASRWVRDDVSTVNRTDRRIVVTANHMTEFALFGSGATAGGGGGGGGGPCSIAVDRGTPSDTPLLALLLVSILTLVWAVSRRVAAR